MSEKKLALEDTWICTHCKWEGSVDDIRKEVVFPGSREEPEEWEWYCPECAHSDDLEEKMQNANWCRTCEDVIVEDEGEQCGVCIMENLERIADEKRGH